MQISIIIPVLNEEDSLGQQLDWLYSWGEKAEIILADGGSTDGSSQVVAAFKEARWLDCPQRGRAFQMNHAARLAKGDVLFFLHADTRPPAQTLSYIRQSLADSEVFAGSFRIRFDHPHWFYRFCASLSKLNYSFSTYGDQGLFVRKKDFMEIGGFQEIPFLEDVEIQYRLRKRGRFQKLPYDMYTSVRRFEAKGKYRQATLNLLLLLAYLLGFSPKRLKKWYPDS
ncbi:MAG: TIGR04283 family arsenosugar biosynthesis glycosyltransferase [Bacteroidota bacterium]